ncbi:prion-like-(Q/N-rich) domain-bearing protein 25 [Crassostrea virginica]
MCSNFGSGFIAIQQNCFDDAVALNKPCQFNEQCSHVPHALCLQGKCGCTEGYSVYDFAAGCLKDNVNVGESCVVNAQCKGSPMSTACENSTCTCTKGYISLGQLCYEEAIALNMPCMFHEQCFDVPHALCLNGNCGCIEGYSAHNSSKCLQGDDGYTPVMMPGTRPEKTTEGGNRHICFAA